MGGFYFCLWSCFCLAGRHGGGVGQGEGIGTLAPVLNFHSRSAPCIVLAVSEPLLGLQGRLGLVWAEAPLPPLTPILGWGSSALIPPKSDLHLLPSSTNMRQLLLGWHGVPVCFVIVPTNLKKIFFAVTLKKSLEGKELNLCCFFFTVYGDGAESFYLYTSTTYFLLNITLTYFPLKLLNNQQFWALPEKCCFLCAVCHLLIIFINAAVM